MSRVVGCRLDRLRIDVRGVLVHHWNMDDGQYGTPDRLAVSHPPVYRSGVTLPGAVSAMGFTSFAAAGTDLDARMA